MPEYNNLCMNCMHEISNPTEACPHCGFYNNTTEQEAPYLPIKSIVSDRYLIGKLTECNGEGATYMGYDIENKTPVTIREFLPDTIATRNTDEQQIHVLPEKEDIFEEYLQGFLDLWRRLARMRGLSSLIVVIDIVEFNGTAYAISEYIEGTTLRDYLLTSSTGYLSWNDARAMFMPVLSTLATLHSAGIIHRGISPTTLIVGKDKKIRISGFSIWQARASYGELNAELFTGYAAIEQYGFEGQQGPWTDIYAFSAVLYRTLIGSTPLEATTRVTNDKMMIPGTFAEQLPAYVINAIINALQILPEDRTKTVEQFRAELSAAPSVTVTDSNFKDKIENERTRVVAQRPQSKKRATSSPTNKKEQNAPKKKHKLHPGIIAALIVFGVGLLILLILSFTVFRDDIGRHNDSNISSSETSEINKSEVPDFVGQLYTSIKENREYTKNFTIFKKEEYNDEVEIGKVISQSVNAGNKVSVGEEITLVVSKGIEQIEFPYVDTRNYDEVEKELRDLGFKVEKVSKYNDSMKTPNTVAGTNREAGELYDKGTKVIVQVWSDYAYNSDSEQPSTEQEQ